MNPNPDLPLNARELFEFDLTGYLIIRNALTKDQVQNMNAIIDRNQKTQIQGKFPYLHLDPLFLELMADSRALALCRYFLGEWFRLDHAFGLQYGPTAINEAGAGREGLHAGPFANQGVFRYSWFNNRPHCGLLVFDYFLEPVKRGDGGLVLVPGSHKLNLPITGQDVFHQVLGNNLNATWLDNPEMNPGDLLIFTEAVIHGTRSWKPKGRRRRNLHMSYSPGYQASRDYEQIRKYLPLARTETQKSILRPPYVLQFDDTGPQLGENTWRSTTK